MSSEKDLTIEALEKKLKIKEGIIDLMGQFTEKLQAEIDDLQENSDKKLKEALANSDACWKLEQEMYVRQRDEARAEVERLREAMTASMNLCSFECSDETYCGRCAPLVRVLRQGQE